MSDSYPDLSQDQTAEDGDLTKIDFYNLFHPPRDVQPEASFSQPSVADPPYFPSSYDVFPNPSLPWSGLLPHQDPPHDDLFRIHDLIGGRYVAPDQHLHVQDLNIADTSWPRQSMAVIDPALLDSHVHQLPGLHSSILYEADVGSVGLHATPHEDRLINSSPSRHDARTPVSTSSLAMSSSSHGYSALEEHGDICPHCDKIFSRPADMRRHILLHGDPKFPCKSPGCGKIFRRQDKLKLHIRHAHPDESLEGDEESDTKASHFKCELCDETFSRRADRNKHKHRKHYRRYECTECSRSFNLRNDLVRHTQAVHRRGSRLQINCPIEGCDYTCVRKDNILRHIRAKHGSDAASSSSKSL